MTQFYSKRCTKCHHPFFLTLNNIQNFEAIHNLLRGENIFYLYSATVRATCQLPPAELFECKFWHTWLHNQFGFFWNRVFKALSRISAVTSQCTCMAAAMGLVILLAMSAIRTRVAGHLSLLSFSSSATLENILVPYFILPVELPGGDCVSLVYI